MLRFKIEFSHDPIITSICDLITFLAGKKLIKISTIDFYKLFDHLSAANTENSFDWATMKLIKDLIDQQAIEMSESMKNDLIQLAEKANALRLQIDRFVTATYKQLLDSLKKSLDEI